VPVGAGHARPAGARQTVVCGKAAGRTCAAPTERGRNKFDVLQMW